jgi:hypothetical protein
VPEMDPTPKRHHALKVLPTEAPWEALLLEVTAFPIAEEQRPFVRQFLARLSTALRRESKLSLDVFLQLFCLRLGGGSDLVSSHGRNWMPKLGLGVWPDRSAPTFWTKDDFAELEPGAKPRTLMHQVLQVTKSEDARLDAINVMQGLGSAMQVMACDGSETFLKNARETLLPPIKDPSFTCFPFYVPLLERTSIEKTSAEQLYKRSCGASVYIRESVEDNGVLLLSNLPLRPSLEKLGGRLEDGTSPVWYVSY